MITAWEIFRNDSQVHEQMIITGWDNLSGNYYGAGMSKTTFRSFNDVVSELEVVHGHQELWLYSGMLDATLSEVIISKHNWKSPKILKRNGRIAAERVASSDSWQLVGDYKNPQSDPCAQPWQSCHIDDYFKGYYLIVG